jgi:hypothetical protein
MSVKSQFGSVGYNENNFLLDSFAVLGADTRKGLDQQTATRIAAMSGYIGAQIEKANKGDDPAARHAAEAKSTEFNGYLARLGKVPSEGVQPIVAIQRNKPGSGM